jgi:hypothetical protein
MFHQTKKMVVDVIVDIFISVGCSLPHLNIQNKTGTKFLKNLIKSTMILLREQKTGL